VKHKVLFISFDFPPCNDIGGSIRSEKFAKYLPKFGWYTRILSLTGCANEEIYPGVVRIPSLTPWHHPYKLEVYGWLLPMFYYALKLLKNDDYNLVYVSCPPFPPSSVAARIKRRVGIPLVVDYRDAWTLGPYKSSTLMGKIISKFIFPALEKKVLAAVDGLIVNTPSALNCYLETFPSLENRIIMIPNGYDEEDFAEYVPGKARDKMILLHCGRFGTAGRDPIHLFEALKLLNNKRLPILLKTIGDQGAGIVERISNLGLNQSVQPIGQIPHKAAIQAMAECDVLINYQEQYETQITPIAGKTYEYLRTGKPILAITPAGDNLDIIQQYSRRYETVPPHDTAAIAEAINALYKDWEQGLLNEHSSPQKNYLKIYNREALTARLADYFYQIVN
jgi:glycosyltransferase involved in cell wall biosynthesis